MIPFDPLAEPLVDRLADPPARLVAIPLIIPLAMIWSSAEMSVKVRIPTQLRTLAGGAGEVQVEGATVGDALKALDAAHPGFAERLFDDNGNIRRFVNVFVGEEDIRFLDGLGTPVPAGAALISVVPAVAGGS